MALLLCRVGVVAMLCIGCVATVPRALAFSFSEEDAKANADTDANAQKIQELVSTPCQQRVKNRKIMTLIAEHTSDGWSTHQERYSPMFQAINSRLRALGLRTYTAEEIRAQIAQAEIDAYFKNDPDAALAASRKLGANYILRGNITTSTTVNPTVHINEVAVRLDFSLTTTGGQTLSDVSAHSESYAGADTLGMAQTLVKEQADQLVAQLYNDYCRKAGNVN